MYPRKKHSLPSVLSHHDLRVDGVPLEPTDHKARAFTQPVSWVNVPQQYNGLVYLQFNLAWGHPIRRQ